VVYSVLTVGRTFNFQLSTFKECRCLVFETWTLNVERLPICELGASAAGLVYAVLRARMAGLGKFVHCDKSIGDLQESE
jgi:hypothetical protein